MARSEARLSTGIWGDQDFRALPPQAQRMYFFLLSQPDLAHDGTLALRSRRWAMTAAGLSTDDVDADLALLCRARFIVIDHETEELLVRSFIRGDRVYAQPNLLRAARKHLPMVESPLLRASLVIELQRIRALDDITKTCVEIIDGMLADLYVEPAPEPSDMAMPNPSADPSPLPSPVPTERTLGDRGVVTAVTTDAPIPYPLDPFPSPLPPPAGTSLALVPRDVAPATTQDLIAEWLEHCRKRPPANVIGQVSKQVKALLGEGIDPADVRAGLANWHHKGVHPSVLPSMVNELMNAGSARHNGSRPSTTDQRVADALALGEEFREDA